ncbi:MAG TPA: nucleoside deaminase [Pseudolabrys sp.]|nr:nucleoside deaminase [Pseudolabrys sp.]
MVVKTENTKTNYFDAGQPSIDAAMIERCIRLSATAAERGELPFAALVCKGDEVVAEISNRVVCDGDVTRHAELVAISNAQKILGRGQLEDCTLYTIVEPCAMCAFAVREARISRVVFSIGSPIMGGLSKWNVLRDTELSHAMPEVFGSVPEVIGGLSQSEAEEVWERWNPVFWAVIKRRGYLGGRNIAAHLQKLPERHSLLRRLFRLHNRRG